VLLHEDLHNDTKRNPRPNEAVPSDKREVFVSSDGVEPMMTSALSGTHPGRLAGKIALVTAAGSGIGRAAALLFAEHGARVAVNSLSEERTTETVALIRAAGGEAVALPGDVAHAADVEGVVAGTLRAFGGIDVLFSNAGRGIRGRVHELSEADWDRVMDVSLKTHFLLARSVVPILLERGGGAIVHTASTFGILASENFAAYNAAKAGVIALTKTMALDYGPTIRVNCICPGSTDTTAVRRSAANAPDPAAKLARSIASNAALKRLADPREVALAALFLASDEASFVTGEALVVDGGQTIDA
jgi:NAD(P)-dependent dehydrogenase (short-subunit alcohol dehydrogenase family)